MIRDYHHVTLVSSVIRHTCHTLYYPYIARPSAWRSDLVIPIHDHMIFFGSVTFWSHLFLNSGATFFAYRMRHTICAGKLGIICRINESTMIHGPWKFSVFNQNDQCNLYDWAVGSPEWWFTGCPIGSNNDRINSAFVIFWFSKKINQNWIDDEILVEFGRGFWFWLIRILVQMTAQFLIEIASLFFSSKKPFWRVSFEHFNILVAVVKGA